MPEYDDRRLKSPGRAVKAVIVNAGAVAIREIPAPDGRLATQALHGEILDVFEEKDGFLRVQCRRDRYVGWAAPDGLSDRLREADHKVTVPRSHAYAAPDLKSPPRDVLSFGSAVTVTEAEGDWRLCEGAGWAHHRHLHPIDARLDDPVAAAELFLHTPYLWGGRTGLGLDCTGLTQQAYEATGIRLPRDSDMQFAWSGTEIDDWRAPGALRRGDLIFWKGHVGLMTSPDHLLHCNAWHMAVAHEPLAEAITRIANYYAEPIGARRIDIASEWGKVPAWLTGA